MPNSSSNVTKTTPEAVPGRWRTSTRPARAKRSPLLRVPQRVGMRHAPLDSVGRSSCSGWARSDIEMVE